MRTPKMANKTRACAKCGLRRREAAYTSPRGRICEMCRRGSSKRNGREARLRDRYGLTLAEYDALYAAQSGKCAGCGGSRRYNLHVDHCHITERAAGVRASVRGLLCARCNKVLRDVRDDCELLDRLADYLTRWPAREVLGDA
jgi:hypothetical protein